METHDDPSFRESVNGATLTWGDSMVLQASRSLRHGVPMLPVLKGAVMMQRLLEEAEKQGISVGLYGASEETIERLKMKLSVDYPDLLLAYALSPPFRPLEKQEETTILSGIREAKVQLLFVGLGCPKQERWMAKHTEELPGVVMIGIGAAFDFNAGVVAPSPYWVHRFGFEWLYRFMREPRRLAYRYLSTSPRFVFLLGWNFIKSKLFAPHHDASESSHRRDGSITGDKTFYKGQSDPPNG
jgi:N-acetylglucosaminyldiphosphoundecaprenol N-acetyl-beta-D-mannosaminyltransferase